MFIYKYVKIKTQTKATQFSLIPIEEELTEVKLGVLPGVISGKICRNWSLFLLTKMGCMVIISEIINGLHSFLS